MAKRTSTVSRARPVTQRKTPTSATAEKKPAKRGFAAMSPTQRREIAKKGARARRAA